MNPNDIKKLIKEEVAKALDEQGTRSLHQSQFMPKMIKQRHLEDVIIKFGLLADLPTDGTTGCRAYFSTDDDTLHLWNGTAWVTEVLS